MWVRESAADPAKLMTDLWNSNHADKIEVTAIPDNQVGGQARHQRPRRRRAGPDVFDLIYMPDFMKAGFLTDLTDQLKADPQLCDPRPGLQGHRHLRGQDLRRRLHPRRLDPRLEQGALPQGRARPRHPAEDDLRDPRDGDEDPRPRRRHLRLLLRRLLPGLQHLRHLAADGRGRRQDPAENGDDAALEARRCTRCSTSTGRCGRGADPASAETDTGENFVSAFTNGNVGITGTGGFLLSLMQRQFPDFDYGVALLPGLEAGQVSGFVGGDVVAIPKGVEERGDRPRFITWVLSDEAQLEGLAKNKILTTRDRPRRQQVLQGQRQGAGDRRGARRRLRSLGVPLHRHGELGLEPVDQHAAAGDLRRRRRRRDHRRPRRRCSTSPASRPARPRAGRRRRARHHPGGGGCSRATTGGWGLLYLLPALALRRRLRLLSARRSWSDISLTSESLLGGGEFVGFDELPARASRTARSGRPSGSPSATRSGSRRS